MKHESPPLSYGSHGSVKSYVIGFAISIALTLFAYFLVERHILTSTTLIGTIVSLAFVQAIVQLIFFLHLGEGQKAYWNFIVFLFMILVLLIIVLGSLWIMYDLDDRLMTPMVH